MDLHHHVVEIFHRNIDSTMQALDEVSSHIATCGEQIVQVLLNDNKLLCCGEGQSAALAQIFCSNLLNRFQYDRPSFPAICLASDATALTAITSDNTFNEIYSKQIRALGQHGDILLLLANNCPAGPSLQAIQAAHERDMLVIAIFDQGNNDIPSLLLPEDLSIRIPCEDRARVAETQLLALNNLCALIDIQLFGSEE